MAEPHCHLPGIYWLTPHGATFKRKPNQKIVEPDAVSLFGIWISIFDAIKRYLVAGLWGEVVQDILLIDIHGRRRNVFGNQVRPIKDDDGRYADHLTLKVNPFLKEKSNDPKLNATNPIRVYRSMEESKNLSRFDDEGGKIDAAKLTPKEAEAITLDLLHQIKE